MQIQVNTDGNIAGSDELVAQVTAIVADDLERWGAQVTRVEAHLSDRNSDKKSAGEDKRCLLEARLSGRQPVAVSHDAASIEEAVEGAAAKLKRSLESTLGRLNDTSRGKARAAAAPDAE